MLGGWGMTKLKTLKDFDWEGNVSVFDGDMTGVDEESIKKELKAEAVKWIKDINHSSITVESWIKHFFNITEEDLKWVWVKKEPLKD